MSYYAFGEHFLQEWRTNVALPTTAIQLKLGLLKDLLDPPLYSLQTLSTLSLVIAGNYQKGGIARPVLYKILCTVYLYMYVQMNFAWQWPVTGIHI